MMNNKFDIFESDIIKKKYDFEFIEKRLNPENKNISYYLIYKCDKENDTPKIFHQKCDGKKNVLVFIETTENVRFGGFTSVGFNSFSSFTLDNNSFLFSIDKRKIYNIKKDKNAIFCSSNYGPCFCGTSSFNIYIECNNFLKGKCHTSPSNNNTYEINYDYELNNSKFEFFIKKLEIFQIEIY